jgi:hypothetical protein
MGGVQEAVEGRAADAKHAGGPDLVAAGEGEDAGNVTKNGPVEVGVLAGAVGGERGEGGRQRRGGPLKAGDVEGANPLAGTIEGRRGDDGLEFANVAWPGVSKEAAEGAGGKTAEDFAVAEAPLTQEQAGEERKVVASVAQRGKEEPDGGEVAGEIGAKGAAGGKAAQRLGGADNQLARSGNREVAEAFVSGPLKEVAEIALLVGGELVDAGEVGQAAVGVLPESVRGDEEI